MQSITGITTGRVTRLTGVTRSQLRYWEAHGVITPILVPHASRVWRVYPDDQVQRVLRIRKLQASGMTLQGAIRQIDQPVGSQQHESVKELLLVA